MKIKKVWILNHYAQEPGGAGGTRHYSLAKHLLAHGWKASVIGVAYVRSYGNYNSANPPLIGFSEAYGDW